MIFNTHDRKSYMEQVQVFLQKMKEEAQAGHDR
jgi:hypothetical protein